MQKRRNRGTSTKRPVEDEIAHPGRTTKIIEIGYRKTAPQPKKGKQDGGKSPPAVTQGRTSAKLVKGKKKHLILADAAA
jgi:hypothetical protein